MSPQFNPLNYPTLFSSPRRLSPYSAWHQHIPFAMFLVGLLKPRTLVELGTFSGDSYCAFCQAVQELRLNTRCYAVDTWEGDLDTGYYGSEVLASLREHHDPIYGSFSRLIKSTFDEALSHFTEETIDLLHIDGYHAYEVVKHDFESWLPKMSERGVVLFHDINVREGDFGVWKFWEEVSAGYPHFEFIHGHGLGVLAVGRTPPEPFQAFIQAASEDGLKIRNFFFQLGLQLSLKGEHLAQLSAEREEFRRESKRIEEAIRGEKDEQIAGLVAEGRQKDEQIARLVEERSQLEDELVSEQQQLRAMEDSLGWRLITKCRNIRNRLLPNGTKRRKLFDHVKDFFKTLIS
jgi:hypothetical protein